MSYVNDREAYILANTYGLNPPKKAGPARLRLQNTGKFEPDRRPYQPTRSMVLASWVDTTNIIVQYHPTELIA
jgi:hypothetical protein